MPLLIGQHASMQTQTIVLATGNQGKVKELARQLQQFPVEIVAQQAFDVPDVEETGTTFVENAIKKHGMLAQ